MGGEKAKGKPKSQGHLGSPPRGRGKATFWDKVRGKVRITPAWAGKSSMTARGRVRSSDHPRVGGEKDHLSRAAAGGVGSPPRGRGKVGLCRPAASRGRITPAWAGKRSIFVLSKGGEKDHPRVGGEKNTGSKLAFLMMGSPPRGRGKAPMNRLKLSQRRITPAWAGKSKSCF